MIQAATIHSCRKCNSRNIIKNGKNACGCQQYLCKDCGCYAVVQPKYRYSQKDKDVIIRAYQERSSMRGIERTFGVCRQTLSAWLKKKPTNCQTYGKLCPSYKK